MQEFSRVQTDMREEFLEQVKAEVIQAFSAPGQSPSEVAEALKNGLDARFGPTWHAVVGRSFGSDVMHEAFSYLCCAYGPWTVLLFKAGYL